MIWDLTASTRVLELEPTATAHACIHLLAGLPFFPVGGYLFGALEWDKGAYLAHCEEELSNNCSTREEPRSTTEPVRSLLFSHTTFQGPGILSMQQDDQQKFQRSGRIS